MAPYVVGKAIGHCRKHLSENYKSILTHLEFLGYEIKYMDSSDESEPKYALAKHEKWGNILCNEVVGGIVHMQILWEAAKSTEAVMNKAIAKASPITNCAVVLVVGAKLLGQASFSTKVFKTMSAF